MAHVDACVLYDELFPSGSKALGRDIANCDVASQLSTFHRDQVQFQISEKSRSLILRTREAVLAKEQSSTVTSRRFECKRKDEAARLSAPSYTGEHF